MIPASATATVGIRLVKGNDQEYMKDLVEARIRKRGYYIAREEPDIETRLRYPKDGNLRIANLWYGIDLYTAILTLSEERVE